MERADEIGHFLQKHGAPHFVTLGVSSDMSPANGFDVTIDKCLGLDASGPGVVMFTSGTSTGIPKAAVLPRQCLVQNRPPKLGEATLSYRPPYWRGGFASLIGPLLSGMKLYSVVQNAPTEAIWDALRHHHITNLVFNPTLLRQMKEVYTAKLNTLADAEREAYVNGFRNLGRIRCSGAFLAPPLLEFWTGLTGLPLKNAYGSTECGGGVTEVNVNRQSKAKVRAATARRCRRDEALDLTKYVNSTRSVNW
ncbi:hypothetical protein CDD83_3814 [Cordyceps sp. RAO-2017]|nr:hypothetical protein CDD83_3814 [Cordyceps sp. RAO-2017]